MEPVEKFEARVLARTGVALVDMPVRCIPETKAAWGMGHIIAHRGNTFVCAKGFPFRIDAPNVEFEVVVITVRDYPRRPDRGGSVE